MSGFEFLIPLAVGAGTAGATALLNKPEDVKLPEPQAPVRLPDPFAEREEAKRNAFDRASRRRGRTSTNLADDFGEAYSNTSLGE